MFVPIVFVAQAQDPTEDRARELFENGSRLYEEGSYEAAILAFKAAYDLKPAPELRYNLANCYERLGDFEEAIRELDLYRAVAPAEERPVLERRIAALEQRRRTASVPTPVSPAPAPPAGDPGPAPLPSPAVRRAPRWGWVGLGAGLMVVGGAGSAATYTAAQSQIEADNAVGYGTSRALNGLSWGAGGAGLVAGTLGLLLPVERTVQVGVNNGVVSLGGSW